MTEAEPGGCPWGGKPPRRTFFSCLPAKPHWPVEHIEEPPRLNSYILHRLDDTGGDSPSNIQVPKVKSVHSGETVKTTLISGKSVVSLIMLGWEGNMYTVYTTKAGKENYQESRSQG